VSLIPYRSGYPAWAAQLAGSGWSTRLRIILIGVIHLAALMILMRTEYGPFATAMAIITWSLLNCLWLFVLRSPGVSAALSLVLLVILIRLSQFKFEILQLALTFLDFLLIDSGTFAFLLSVFPQLKGYLIVASIAVTFAIWVIWKLDPFRIRRTVAAAGAAVCMMLIAAFAAAVPEQPWEPFQGVNHISNLARSGAVAVSHLVSTGWIEADAKSSGKLPGLPATPCEPPARRPHVILLLDESSFDITAAPNVKVPDGYRDYFKSVDGRQRTFVAEATGGPTWYTEYNVLAGLSAQSFGNLKFYVTRIASGRVKRGLPLSLRRCGYKTYSLYPASGDFLDARGFQKTTGIDYFIDMADMGVDEDMQPDSFYFDQALKVFTKERGGGSPLFMFVYLTANHFSWTWAYRPDLTPHWKPPGNAPETDEYLRRQAMTVKDYNSFVARLKEDFPDESFLIVRFGDHQPAISQKLLEPGLDPKLLGSRIMTRDVRYYSTYYAIDGVNFQPRDLSSSLETLDAAYLPIAVLEAAGIPLDPSFEEQKKIMLRCNGLFYACKNGAEARRFNRLLIDAGMIKGL
jgi:Sulfatase